MITVNVETDIEDDLQLSPNITQNICRSVLKNEKHLSGEVTFIITGDEELRALKKRFFDLDIYTDVITFNLEDDGDPVEGEIYISWERVQDNAQKLDQDVDVELKRMMVHGSLHLVGYDDQTAEEEHQMRSLEEKYLNLNPEPLILL